MFDDLWVDPVPLATLRPPPAHLVTGPGGRTVRVRVMHRGHKPLYMPGVVLAWARLPREEWAVLLVWSAYRIRGDKEIETARWSWVRFESEVINTEPSPLPGNVWGHPWYGQIDGFEQAAAQAAATLPEPMRADALKLHPKAPVSRAAPS